MKSLFKKIAIGFFSSSQLLIATANAGQGIVITYDKQSEYADKTEQILMTQFNIPKKLIDKIWMRDPCAKKMNESIVHICISDEKEIQFPFIKQLAVKETFSIFYSSSETNNH